jgi:hypothetical protein
MAINENTVQKLADSASYISISNGVLAWIGIIMGSLIFIILLLTWLLVRREKALQIMAFSISPVGLKLTYELNKDEKLKSLALDNLALEKEIRILKGSLSKERWRSIGMLITFFVIFVVFFVLDKLKWTKSTPAKAEPEPLN